MKEHHIKKYMRLAKHWGEDNNPCYSRHIGTVIVNEEGTNILGTGYNGPPRDTPHTDSADYLENIVWPQLTDQDKVKLGGAAISKEHFTHIYKDCKTCPRKLLGIESGKRLEFCSCVHSEANAIVNSSKDLHGSYMFCWCPLPCYECAKLIINAGIKKVYALEGDYGFGAGTRFLFRKKGVELIQREPEWYLN